MPNEHPLPLIKSDQSMRVCLILCLAGIIGLGILSPVYQYFDQIAQSF